MIKVNPPAVLGYTEVGYMELKFVVGPDGIVYPGSIWGEPGLTQMEAMTEQQIHHVRAAIQTIRKVFDDEFGNPVNREGESL